MDCLPRPVMIRIWSQPEAMASSTPYWMMGLSTMGSISLGWALVAGRKRVPRPAAGMTALRILMPFILPQRGIRRRHALDAPLSYVVGPRPLHQGYVTTGGAGKVVSRVSPAPSLGAGPPPAAWPPPVLHRHPGGRVVAGG